MQFSLLCKRIISFILACISSICFWLFMVLDTSDIEIWWTVLILLSLFISTAISCIVCMHYIVCDEQPRTQDMEELDEEETQTLLV